MLVFKNDKMNLIYENSLFIWTYKIGSQSIEINAIKRICF